MAGDEAKHGLIEKIATEIAEIPRLAPDWTSLSIVFTFENRFPSNFGYYYTGESQQDWGAFSSASDELDEDVAKLRDMMTAETRAEWHQALFQLLRDRREMKLEFAYDGETRWRVTPDNLDQIVRALRPL